VFTYAVFRQLGDVIKNKLIGIAQDVLRSFVGVWEDLANDLDTLLEVVELRMTTELVSDL
jgi:hypothetical protein